MLSGFCVFVFWVIHAVLFYLLTHSVILGVNSIYSFHSKANIFIVCFCTSLLFKCSVVLIATESVHHHLKKLVSFVRGTLSVAKGVYTRKGEKWI